MEEELQKIGIVERLHQAAWGMSWCWAEQSSQDLRAGGGEDFLVGLEEVHCLEDRGDLSLIHKGTGVLNR